MTYARSLLFLVMMGVAACGDISKKPDPVQPVPPEQQPPSDPEQQPPAKPCPFPIPAPLPCPIPPGIPIPPIPGNPLPPIPGNPAPNPDPGTPDPNQPDIVKALLVEVNAARKSRGLSEVAFDGKLDCAAQRHAADIGPKRICGHTGSDGSSPWQRASACGTSANGEIVACGQGSPKAAVDAWTLSPGHAAIMYDGGQKAMGGGWNGNYWVVIFRK
jgi:uncharacterized protein YkwD